MCRSRRRIFRDSSRAAWVESLVTSTGSTQNITSSADLGATYDVTEEIRINDSFRWYNFRLPGAGTLATTGLFSPSAIVPANMFSATTCPAPYTGVGCPQHSASSGADLSVDMTANYEAQDQKVNTFELEYDFNRESSRDRLPLRAARYRPQWHRHGEFDIRSDACQPRRMHNA